MNQLREQWNQLKQRLQTLRDRAAEGWGRFSPRDQQIISITGIGGVVFFAGMIVVLAGSHLGKLHRDIDKRGKALGEIHDLRSEFKGAKDRLDAINLRLRANTAAPKTFLEDKARETGTNVESMEERPAPPNDLFKAQLIEVRLKKVTLANLTRFLYKIENANVGMTVHSLELTTNFQDNKYLDGKLLVQALRPKE